MRSEEGGVMDIQKEREAFEVWLRGYIKVNPDCWDMKDYEKESMFHAWQAAKAQAVPDGFVVVPKELSAKMVDKLADVICDTFDTTIKGSENCAREAYKAMIEAGELK